jgi:hypothetical protein
VQLVHEIVREECLHELAATVRDDVLAGLCLEGTDLLDGVTAEDRRVPQSGFSRVFETTYLAGAFIRSPNGSPGAIGSNAPACVT